MREMSTDRPTRMECMNLRARRGDEQSVTYDYGLGNNNKLFDLIRYEEEEREKNADAAAAAI